MTYENNGVAKIIHMSGEHTHEINNPLYVNYSSSSDASLKTGPSELNV